MWGDAVLSPQVKGILTFRWDPPFGTRGSGAPDVHLCRAVRGQGDAAGSRRLGFIHCKPKATASGSPRAAPTGLLIPGDIPGDGGIQETLAF